LVHKSSATPTIVVPKNSSSAIGERKLFSLLDPGIPAATEVVIIIIFAIAEDNRAPLTRPTAEDQLFEIKVLLHQNDANHVQASPPDRDYGTSHVL
jgi:hypothetical protein